MDVKLYYSVSNNYRVLLSNISVEVIEEWKKQLEEIERTIS